MSLFEKIVWGIAGIALIPILINPAAWVVAVAVAGGVLLLGYGGRFAVREGLEMERARRTGEKAGRTDQTARNTLLNRDRDGDRRWRR